MKTNILFSIALIVLIPMASTANELVVQIEKSDINVIAKITNVSNHSVTYHGMAIENKIDGMWVLTRLDNYCSCNKKCAEYSYKLNPNDSKIEEWDLTTNHCTPASKGVYRSYIYGSNGEIIAISNEFELDF